MVVAEFEFQRRNNLCDNKLKITNCINNITVQV